MNEVTSVVTVFYGSSVLGPWFLVRPRSLVRPWSLVNVSLSRRRRNPSAMLTSPRARRR